MREVIGFNLICAAIAFIIICCCADLDTKEKAEFMACEICAMAVISLGVCLLAGV